MTTTYTHQTKISPNASPVVQGPWFDAVVIGGGLAGLSAASRLQAVGASVLLLEARNRIGGRVHSQKLDTGHTIDLGAQFIADTQRRISALVDEVGLTRVALPDKGSSIYLPTPDAEPVVKNGDDLPLSFLGQLDVFLAMRGAEGVLESFRNDVPRWDAMPASAFVRNMTFLREPSEFLAGYAEGELCTSLDALSAYELLDQAASIGGVEGEGGSAQWFLAEGTGPLAQHLAERLGKNLLLDSPVLKIEPAPEGWNVHSATGIHRTRKLIVAVPPQLYANIGLLPLLPEHRQRALQHYQLGHVIKTVLVFPEPWWRKHGVSGSILSAGSVFNSSMDCSPADGGAGVLVLFATAGSARQLGVLRTEAERCDRAIKWLADLSDVAVPSPIAARSLNWNAEPYSLGGYASRRDIGGWTSAADLFAPLPDLHFAGSETANEWRSFMEGALQSGERAADAVLVESLVRQTSAPK